VLAVEEEGVKGAPPLELSKRARLVEDEAAAGAAWAGWVACEAACDGTDVSPDGSFMGRLRDGGCWEGSWRAGGAGMVTEVGDTPELLELEYRW